MSDLDVLRVACPYCHASPGEPCLAPGGSEREPHRPRLRRATRPWPRCRFCWRRFDPSAEGTRVYCCPEHAARNRRHVSANRTALAATLRPRGSR